MEFKVVDESFRQSASRGRKSANAEAFTTLEAGETLLFDVEPKRIQGWYEAAKKRGFTMSARKADADGKPGCVVWWEKNPAVTEGN